MLIPVRARRFMKIIKDQYTEKQVSRQMKYQLRNKEKGLCIKCPKTLARNNGNFCEEHLKETNKRQRERYKKVRDK